VTGSFWSDLLIGIVGALLLAWLALVIALAILRPRGGLLREALRILPDVLRLVRRLAADGTPGRAVFASAWGCCWPTSRSQST
jgi:hypothetical protein